MLRVGQRIIFWSYVDDMGELDPIFRRGDFGVVVKLDGDAAECLLTDALGEVVWWRGDTLFPEEFIPLRYAPLVPHSRLPLPYGSRFGEPA